MESIDDKMLGIGWEEYRELLAAQSLQGIYDMDDELSNTAFRTAKEMKLPLEEAYKLISYKEENRQ